MTEEAWAHIVDEHDDMIRRQDDVRAAVESPDFVMRDANYARRENHYRRPDPDAAWTKVVVNYLPEAPDGDWVGEIVTAHRTRTVPRKETPLWP